MIAMQRIRIAAIVFSSVLTACAVAAAGVLLTPQGAGMVVNGTSEADWPQVRRLAEQCPSVIPAFGLHPWRVSVDWGAMRWRFCAGNGLCLA